MVGTCLVPTGDKRSFVPTVWRDTKATVLETDDGTGFAKAINDDGVIVGQDAAGPVAWPDGDRPAAALSPVLQDLHATSIVAVLDVNAAGQILLSVVIDNAYHAVVLTP
jgi:hypothetical protein